MTKRFYKLEREQVIGRSRKETFAFFSNAFNLERITPPFLRFHVITPPPITMAASTLIEYSLSLLGVPFRWLTVIDSWRPEESFVDIQLSGPYRLWHHTHTFEEIGTNRTLMRDRVLYQMPFGMAGAVAQTLFVRRTLERIFDYRAEMTARLLAPRKESKVIIFPRAPKLMPDSPEVA